MRTFILASHGSFAKGIYESIEIIVGKQENVHILTAFVDGKNDVKELVDDVLSSIPIDHEVIVCTDIFGGSVNNEFMSHLPQRDNMYLITGMNLPLLMQLFLSAQVDTQRMIQEIVQSEETGVRYCNAMLEKVEQEDFDEF